MNLNFPKRIGALLMGVVLATAGCSDDKTTTVTTLPGTITGIVKKGTAPVAGVVVAPSPADGPSVTTGLDGRYRLTVLPGSYSLSFTGDNLEPATASATVGAGETVTVDQTMAPSTLQVTVTVPDALRFGGPAGFDTTVAGITASATVNGEAVSPEVTWTITDYYGLSSPPAAAEPSPATGTTTSFSIPDFETVRQGANAWLNARYGLTGNDRIQYIQTPKRHGLLSFGTEQVRAMSFKVTARAQVGSRIATGSAVVAPVTISSGGNTQPLGMMVVGNAPPPASGETASYAWSLTYLPSTATTGTEFGAPPEGVVLKGADTKNPYVVPTTAGVYKLANGANELLFRVSTYHGAGSADTDVGTDGVACADCHEGEHTLAPKFAEWRGSAHANHNWKDPFAEPMTLLEYELKGLDKPVHYSESCIACHTVGYSKVPTAQNNGFDDVAAATGWTYPGTYGDEAWATVESNPGLNHRAGMQCESCHGPLEPTDHGSVGAYRGLAINFGTVAPASSMDSGVCMTCHDAFSHHDRSALWAASGHANLELAMNDGTVEARGVGGSGANQCGRCHSGGGFVTYLEQQQAGNPGNIARPPELAAAAVCEPREGYKRNGQPYDPLCPCKPASGSTTCTGDTAFAAYLGGHGMAMDTVQSQTCQTCHDPHSTELRVSGDTKTVAALFEIKNAGAGAACIVCHNTRSNAVRQGTYALADWTAPHVAAQADVFAGRNAFFVAALTAGQPATELPKLSAHAFMAETCADCHVKWVPADLDAQFKIANTNHTFKASREVCAECHAPNIGELVAEQTEEKLQKLENLVGVAIREKLNAGGFDAPTRIDPDTDADLEAPADATVDAGQVMGVELAESHGGPAVKLTLRNGTRFMTRMSNIFVVDSTTTKLFSVAEETGRTQTVARAYYNYLLVHGDGTEGMHNPSFVREVLDSTIAAMNGVTIP